MKGHAFHGERGGSCQIGAGAVGLEGLGEGGGEGLEIVHGDCGDGGVEVWLGEGGVEVGGLMRLCEMILIRGVAEGYCFLMQFFDRTPEHAATAVGDVSC